MEVRNCRSCGRLYNYIGGSYRNLCPDCIRKIEDKFQDVKDYIEEHRAATISMISQDCDVSTKQIEQWIREERLVFSEDSPIGIGCEICGATIKSGRYCEQCKSNMVNNLGSMYGTKSAATAPSNNTRDSARMRFLDK
ncbi:MAG: flagellar protein [Lachnospira sp.]